MNDQIAQYINNDKTGATVFPVGVEPTHLQSYSPLSTVFLTVTENLYAFLLPLLLPLIIKLIEALTTKRLSKTMWWIMFFLVLATEAVIFFFKYRSNPVFNYY